MSKARILVVEDESIVSRDIQNTLQNFGYSVVGSASSGEKAVFLAEEIKPDLILMDIMLKNEMSGVEAGSLIRKKQNTPIIFMTAFTDDKTIEAVKKTEPYGYLVKPVKEIELKTTIEIALHKHLKELHTIQDEKEDLFEVNEVDKDFIFVKANLKYIKINLSEIYFVEALKDYVTIHVSDKRYTIHSTMKDIAEKLGIKYFLRVHRSFIVRIDKIASVSNGNIILEEQRQTIPVGGSYKEDLNKCISGF